MLRYFHGMPLIRILLVAWLFRGGPALAQWCDPAELAALQHRLDTSLQIGHRYDALMSLAAAWTVSAKAAPYLAQADLLYERMMRDPDEELRKQAIGSTMFRLYLKGYQAKFHRDMSQALTCFREGLRVDTLLRPGSWARFKNNEAIGSVYASLGLHQLAINSFKTQLEWAQKLGAGDVRHATQAHLQLASVYTDMHEWDRVRTELAACDTTNAADHAAVLVTTARIQDLQGDVQLAGDLFARAATIVERSDAEWDRIGVLQPKARFHLAMGDAHNALDAAEECARIAGKWGDEAAWCGCRIMAGEARLLLGDERGMERDLRSALDTAHAYHYVGLARETGDEGSMVHAAALLKDLYRQQARMREALDMTTLWAELLDTLHRTEGREGVLRYDLQMETLKDSVANAQRIERATVDYQRQLNEERQGRRAAIIGGSIALVAVLIAVAWYAERHRRKAKHEREQAVLEERLRIADDLHDDIGAGLSSLKLRSALALERPNAPDQEKALRSLAGTADGLMDNMRQILWAMGTEHTQLADLVRYITVYARQTLEEHGIALTMDVDRPIPEKELNGLERRNIFLVAKEALHNVVKHAHAQQVTVTFRWKSGLEMHVQDDGGGMVTPDATKGSGMRTMRKRAVALGGTIEVATAAEGTTIRLHVPLGTTLNKRPIAVGAPRADLHTDG